MAVELAFRRGVFGLPEHPLFELAAFPDRFRVVLRRHSVTVYLEQVVQHRHQLPLSIDLRFASQAEAPQPQRLSKMTEDRFDNPQAHAVNVAAQGGVDLLFHTNQRAVLCFGQYFQQDVDLPGSFLLGTAQALGA